MSVSVLPPMRVPTLTEVVEWSALSTVAVDDVAPWSAPDAGLPHRASSDEQLLPVLSEAVLPEDCAIAEAAPTSAPIDEAALTQQILTDLQRQVDLMLEYRLQAVLAPVLERLTHALAQEARDELALTLRDVVAKAVSRELTRHRSASERVEPL